MSFRFLSAKSDKPKKPKKQKKQKKQPKSYLELLPHGFVFFLFFLFFLVLCFFWFLFFFLCFLSCRKIFVCWSNVCQRVEFLHLPKVCLDWHAFYVHFAHARGPLFCIFSENKMRSRKASDLQTLGLNELYDMVIFKLSTWDVLWKVKIWRLTVLTRMWKWEWLMVFPSLWHHYMCCVHKLLKPQVLRSLCSSEWFYKTAINNAIEEKMLRSPWVLEKLQIVSHNIS